MSSAGIKATGYEWLRVLDTCLGKTMAKLCFDYCEEEWVGLRQLFEEAICTESYPLEMRFLAAQIYLPACCTADVAASVKEAQTYIENRKNGKYFCHDLGLVSNNEGITCMARSGDGAVLGGAKGTLFRWTPTMGVVKIAQMTNKAPCASVGTCQDGRILLSTCTDVSLTNSQTAFRDQRLLDQQLYVLDQNGLILNSGQTAKTERHLATVRNFVEDPHTKQLIALDDTGIHFYAAEAQKGLQEVRTIAPAMVIDDECTHNDTYYSVTHTSDGELIVGCGSSTRIYDKQRYTTAASSSPGYFPAPIGACHVMVAHPCWNMIYLLDERESRAPWYRNTMKVGTLALERDKVGLPQGVLTHGDELASFMVPTSEGLYLYNLNDFDFRSDVHSSSEYRAPKQNRLIGPRSGLFGMRVFDNKTCLIERHDNAVIAFRRGQVLVVNEHNHLILVTPDTGQSRKEEGKRSDLTKTG